MITTKQLTAVLAVTALLAVGVIGVGYAYTASVDNTGNEATVEYLTVKPTSGLETDFSHNFDKEFELDTVTTWENDSVVVSYIFDADDKVTGAKYAGNDVNCGKVGEIALTVAAPGQATIPAYDMKVLIPAANADANCTYYAYTSTANMSKFVTVGDDLVAILPQVEDTAALTVSVAVEFAASGTAAKVLTENTALTFKADTEVYGYDVTDVAALYISGAVPNVVIDGTDIEDLDGAKAAITTNIAALGYTVELKNGLTKALSAEEATASVTNDSTTVLDDITEQPAAGDDADATVTFTINTNVTKEVPYDISVPEA